MHDIETVQQINVIFSTAKKWKGQPADAELIKIDDSENLLKGEVKQIKDICMR